MSTLYIVGLGPGDLDYITMKAWHLLNQADPLFLKTDKTPVASSLRKRGIKYFSFDYLINKEGNNNKNICYSICDKLIKSAQSKGQAVYGIAENLFSEDVSIELLKRNSQNLRIEVIPGPDLLDTLISLLGINSTEGLLTVDAGDLRALEDAYRYHLFIVRVNNFTGIKLKLQKVYPQDHPVKAILFNSTFSQIKIKQLSLSELNYITGGVFSVVYVPPLAKYSLGQMAELMRRLRQECPWDREQDHFSLRPYVIEEAYEVVNAINEGKSAELKEELGDLLLQVVFHSEIAREKGDFGIPEIISEITLKLRRRHPHIFGNMDAKDAVGVAGIWRKEKEKEKENYGRFSMARNLPSLVRAKKVQIRAAEVGFDWPDAEGVVEKVNEELGELIDAYKEGEKVKIEEEIGDLLFSMVNLARFLKIDPEVALSATIEKFISRFTYIEEQVARTTKNITEYSLEELDNWWKEAKNKGN